MAGKGTRVLQDYFDQLLTDAAETVAGAPATEQEHKPALQPQPRPTQEARPFVGETLMALERSKREKLQALLNSKPLVALLAEAAPAPVVEASPVLEDRIPPAVEALSFATEVEEAAPQATEAEMQRVSRFLAWHENGRPHWAQERFDALIFNVSGLKLAVPLIALGQIQPLTDELTPIFGQADWFMGLLPTPTGSVRTVNTALFVMPEKYDPQFPASARYVVSIEGLPWGLAVDSIEQPVSLDPDDVKWRTERGKRPWLAGTVKSAMCALIDIPQMGHMLTEADVNGKS